MTMTMTFGIRRMCARLGAVVLFAFLLGGLFGGTGCGGGNHRLSGLELQELKRQEIQRSGESLTAEQQFQIRTIQVNTKGEFESAVAKIKAGK
jgi:hypothetical protein